MTAPDDLVIAAPDELTSLKARADLMGISYHPSIGLEKLREKVNAALAVEKPAGVVAEEDEAAQRRRAIEEATKLVRVRVNCMNPAKKEWSGEIITVGNSVVGTHKKYIPFNAEDGWHIPHIMYEALLGRECQVFVTVTDSRGNKSRKGRIIKEFAVEVLPPLSQEELAELARRQAMAGNVD